MVMPFTIKLNLIDSALAPAIWSMLHGNIGFEKSAHEGRT